MSEENGPAGGGDWFGTPLSLRPTPRRKAKLAAIAKSLGPGATPFEAIEAAVDFACSRLGEAPDSGALGEIAEAIERLADERRAGEAAMRAAVEASALHAKRTLELISAAMSLEGGEEGAPGFGAWLDGELAAMSPQARSAAARVRWAGASIDSAGLAAIRFDASLIAADGRALAGRLPDPATVAVRAVGAGDPLHAAMASLAGRELLAGFQRGADGRWAGALFRAKPDGTFGERVAALAI